MLANQTLGRGNLLASARSTLGRAVCLCIKDAFGVELDEKQAQTVIQSINRPKNAVENVSAVEIGIPAASLMRFLSKLNPRPKPVDIAEALSTRLEPMLASSDETKEVQDFRDVAASVKAVGAYVNFNLRPSFIASIVDQVVGGEFLKPLPITREHVMVEYSQPNTHKAFHVGHMRNVALGDSISRIYKHLGYDVKAVNYFGDEGAHVAKCLWLLSKRLKEANIDIVESDTNETLGEKIINGLNVPKDHLGEYLGLIYAKSVEELDIESFTKYPYVGLVAAKVLSVEPHPENPAWNIAKVQYGQDSSTDVATVVCGGVGYKVNDIVAYAPVGITFKKIQVVPKDMKGVTSSGIMVGFGEVGETPEPSIVERAKEMIAAMPKPTPAAEEPPAAEGKKKKKGKKKKEPDMLSKLIWIVEPETENTAILGQPLTELGRLPDAKIDANTTVVAEMTKRKEEVSATLQGMESGDMELTKLWDVTKKWSLDEFKSIYNWLGAHFDHDFFESEVGAESKQMCLDFFKKGKLIELEGGAIGADLSKYKLGMSILIKSDGTGLYATKDLALARRKFEKYGIDKSIYVVDDSQKLHFQQVFKVLELMEFEQAKNCVHVPYGQVVLPDGKMSSRKGTVVYFSQLKEQLHKEIDSKFFSQYRDGFKDFNGTKVEVEKWSEEEIANANRCISVATIRYRMLNVDPIRTTAFDLKDWTADSGDTGPYNMYTYAARTQSILRKVQAPKDVKREFDVQYLSDEQSLKIMMHMSDFWKCLESASGSKTTTPNPSIICHYMYDLSSDFNSWYKQTSVKGSASPEELMSKLLFVEAVGNVLRTCMNVLGIEVIERM